MITFTDIKTCGSSSKFQRNSKKGKVKYIAIHVDSKGQFAYTKNVLKKVKKRLGNDVAIQRVSVKRESDNRDSTVLNFYITYF